MAEKPLWQQAYDTLEEKEKLTFEGWSRRASALRRIETEMVFDSQFGKRRCLVCRQYLGPNLSHMR